ncbi:hypothetical protein BV22DRAFT_1135710, partial [Leucogyrophana mollusca]
MSENTPPAWPPLRRRKHHHNSSTTTPSTPDNTLSHNTTPSTPLPSSGSSHSVSSPRTPPGNTINQKSHFYRNGYETKPQTPSYKPYALPATGRKRKHTFAFDDAAYTL